jgi:hypothetical protein
MHRLLAVGLLVGSFFLITTAESCDGKNPAEKVAAWVARWKNDAALGGELPSRFRPPKIGLSMAAVTTKHDVTEASGPFEALRHEVYGENSEQAARYTKEVLCNWFGWYVEDLTHAVPDESTFLGILLESGLKVALRAPPSQQIQEVNTLFRNAILRARGSTGDASRNEAIAAACSIPLP